jgi:hypothetical protein
VHTCRESPCTAFDKQTEGSAENTGSETASASMTKTQTCSAFRDNHLAEGGVRSSVPKTSGALIATDILAMMP